MFQTQQTITSYMSKIRYIYILYIHLRTSKLKQKKTILLYFYF